MKEKEKEKGSDARANVRGNVRIMNGVCVCPEKIYDHILNVCRTQAYIYVYNTHDNIYRE